MLNYINRTILQAAKKVKYEVKDIAPQTELDLFSSGLIIWSGASDSTIYQDPQVNWAFRALHDSLHLKTRLDFSVEQEIELGRIQASKFDSDLIQELIYCEIALQAQYFAKTGQFVKDQVQFTKDHFAKIGLNGRI